MRIGTCIQSQALRNELNAFLKKAGYDLSDEVGEGAVINLIEDVDHQKTLSLLERPDVQNAVVILTDNDDDLLVAYGKRNVSYCVFPPIDYDVIFNRIFDIVKTYEGEEVVAAPEIDYSRTIADILIDLGVSPNLKGYRYLIDAVNAVAKDINQVKGITVNLYPCLARQYDTKPQNIERNIRHAIEAAWNKGRLNSIDPVFGNTVSKNKDKPTNSEFIARVADYAIFTQQKEEQSE